MKERTEQSINERRHIRVQYRDGRWADLSEKQFEAICKVSGIEKLMPHIKVFSSNPDVAIDIRLSKGGNK